MYIYIYKQDKYIICLYLLILYLHRLGKRGCNDALNCKGDPSNPTFRVYPKAPK